MVKDIYEDVKNINEESFGINDCMVLEYDEFPNNFGVQSN